MLDCSKKNLPEKSMQIRLDRGSLHQIYSHPEQIDIPTDSKNCSTILGKLQEDRFGKYHILPRPVGNNYYKNQLVTIMSLAIDHL